MGLSLLLMNRLWAGHVSHAFVGGMGSYHAMSAEALGGGFAEKTGEDLANISRAFMDALVQDGRLLWLLLVLAAVTLLLYKCRKWREFRGYVLAGAGIWLGWTVGMLAMYFTSMSLGEALRVAAFERYYASVLVFGGGYFYILSMLAVERLCPERKKLGIRLAGLVLCILLILPDFSYLVPQKMRPSPAYDIRCRFDNLVEQHSIPSGFNYIVFARGQNEIEARVICTYLLQPGNTLICADGKVQGIEDDWGSFDYYIVLDEDGTVADFLTEQGKERLAGYIW